SHVSRHPHTRKHARRKAGCADRTRRAVEHRTVRRSAAAEVMALHQASESAALAHPDHINLVLGLELIHQNLIAGLQIVIARTEPELAQELRTFHTGLLQMSGGRLVDALRLDELDQSELDRVVAISGRRLTLDHHTWTGLEQRHRHDLPIRPEHLRHSNLFTQNAWSHIKSSQLPVFSSQQRYQPS